MLAGTTRTQVRLNFLLQGILRVTPDNIVYLCLSFTRTRYFRQRFCLGFPLPTSHPVRRAGVWIDSYFPTHEHTL